MDWRDANGVRDRTRRAQASYWFNQDVQNGLLALLQNDAETARRMQAAQAEVAAGHKTPAAAAAEVLAPLRDRL